MTLTGGPSNLAAATRNTGQGLDCFISGLPNLTLTILQEHQHGHTRILHIDGCIALPMIVQAYATITPFTR